MATKTTSTKAPRSVSRIRITLILVLVMLVALAVRLVWIQGLDPSDAAGKALDARTTTQVLSPVRGQILDSSGSVLATSIVRYDLVVDQRQVKASYTRPNPTTKVRESVQSTDVVNELADTLGLDRDAVQLAVFGEEGAKKKGYSIITKGITPEAKDKAEDVGFPYLTAIQTSQRSYPNDSLAGSLIGFLSSEGKGAESLELSQDAALTGTPGKRVYEKGGDGVRIPSAPLQETPAVNGQSIRLTIDKDIQWRAQEAVMAKQKQFKAEWVNAVVMDVKTGKLLALADSTSMDPNNPGATDPMYRRSTTITQAFEPGSTGKLPTFALALEQGKITPTTPFRVPNAIRINNETINDSLKHQTFEMTAAGILARSYNTGTVQIGGKLSDTDRYDFMSKLGLGKKIDIGLNGASAGLLAQPQDWERRQKLTTMFGQGYTQTALHTASIFQAVGNEGVQIAPRLIDAYIDPDGTEHPVEASSTQRVVSEQTSADMRRMMETVVTDGTSKAMQINGYRVGGKSGTAQAQGSDGKLDQHTSSFVGMVPIEDPQYLVVVTMHRPQGNWRTWSVGDSFTQIMSAVLSKYSVAPDTTKPDPYKVFVGKQQEYGW